MRHDIALALTWAGVVIAVLACLGAAVAIDTLPRLHFTTAITSVGTPLVGTGLCVESGIGLTTATVVLIVVVVMVSGPVLSAAVARTAAQRQGIIPPEEPQ